MPGSRARSSRPGVASVTRASLVGVGRAVPPLFFASIRLRRLPGLAGPCIRADAVLDVLRRGSSDHPAHAAANFPVKSDGAGRPASSNT